MTASSSQSIKTSQQRILNWQGLLDAATQVSICATDVDGIITLFNSGAEKMLGYKASEMVGKRTPADHASRCRGRPTRKRAIA